MKKMRDPRYSKNSKLCIYNLAAFIFFKRQLFIRSFALKIFKYKYKYLENSHT